MGVNGDVHRGRLAMAVEAVSGFAGEVRFAQVARLIVPPQGFA